MTEEKKPFRIQPYVLFDLLILLALAIIDCVPLQPFFEATSTKDCYMYYAWMFGAYAILMLLDIGLHTIYKDSKLFDVFDFSIGIVSFCFAIMCAGFLIRGPFGDVLTVAAPGSGGLIIGISALSLLDRIYINFIRKEDRNIDGIVDILISALAIILPSLIGICFNQTSVDYFNGYSWIWTAIIIMWCLLYLLSVANAVLLFLKKKWYPEGIMRICLLISPLIISIIALALSVYYASKVGFDLDSVITMTAYIVVFILYALRSVYHIYLSKQVSLLGTK